MNYSLSEAGIQLDCSVLISQSELVIHVRQPIRGKHTSSSLISQSELVLHVHQPIRGMHTTSPLINQSELGLHDLLYSQSDASIQLASHNNVSYNNLSTNQN